MLFTDVTHSTPSPAQVRLPQSRQTDVVTFLSQPLLPTLSSDTYNGWANDACPGAVGLLPTLSSGTYNGALHQSAGEPQKDHKDTPKLHKMAPKHHQKA